MAAFEPEGGTTLLQAKTNEVLNGREQVELAIKGELINRDQAVAHVFKMARASAMLGRTGLRE